MKKMRILYTLPGVLLLIISAWVIAGEGLYSPPGLPKAKEAAGEHQCVEPVDIMRRRHMLFIKHQRNETMYRGIRTTRYSLVECVNCHVTPNEEGGYPSAKSKQHFCTACHNYAAVRIDCFQCHASKPEEANGGAGHE
jgi:hypothetical protein